MPHKNSAFHTLTKLIPWTEFERSVAAHGADAKAPGKPETLAWNVTRMFALEYAKAPSRKPRPQEKH